MPNTMVEFPSVFEGKIQMMEGEEFHISLTEDAKPFCVCAPRSIPCAYRDKLKAELDLLQEQGIIAPVTVPTEWCAPIVVTPKKDTKDKTVRGPHPPEQVCEKGAISIYSTRGGSC